MNKERLSKLAEDLLDIPSRISEIQGRILDHNEEIQTTNNEISQIEATIKSEIGAQLDDNGKKLYTNAESREAAFVEISNSNQELVSKRNRLSSLQGYVSIERIKMESLSNEQRNIRAVLYFFGGNFEDVV
jgi:predicted  nucleic acid-binding Zn-ribbon protein